MEKPEEKLKRSANFSFSERSLLVQIAMKHKGVVENKKTDAITWREKDEVWKKIEWEFNSYGNGPPRNAKQLKNKYEAIKKELKKKHSSNLKYVRGTGGGHYKPPSPPKTEEEVELTKLISLSIEGLQSKYDSDGLAGIHGQPLEMVAEVENKNNEVTINDDWSSASCTLWQTPKHKKLNIFQLSDDDDVHENDEAIEIVIEKDGHEENLRDCSEKDGTDSKLNENDNFEKDTGYSMKFKASKETGKADGRMTMPGTSKGTGRIMGYSKEQWSARRRPVVAKRKSMSSVSAKFELVAAQQLELIALQRNQVLTKTKHDQEEHDLRMKILQLKFEKQQTKLEFDKKLG